MPDSVRRTAIRPRVPHAHAVIVQITTPKFALFSYLTHPEKYMTHLLKSTSNQSEWARLRGYNETAQQRVLINQQDLGFCSQNLHVCMHTALGDACAACVTAALSMVPADGLAAASRLPSGSTSLNCGQGGHG